MFDIDKLFLSTIFYKKHDTKDQSGNILSRSVNTSWKEGTEQYYANKLIFDQIALLKDSKSFNNLETRSMHYGDASIDSDTKLLTDIVDDLEITSDESVDPYDTYSLWRNTQIRDQFITGKFGIGPFALNNNNHILTMLYGVKFKRTPGSILNITGHESLCENDDMYGESILSWLSGLINSHVDVAKDPFISKLNVNKYTYNLVNLMVRTGFGKMTFYFTTQPIMKELALRVNNAASAYGSNGSKSKYRRQADAENDFILEFANSWLAKLENTDKFNTVFDALEAFENSRLKKLGTNRSDLFESIFSNKSDLLRQIAKSGKNYNDSDAKFTVETKHGTVELTMQDIQMLVYDAKLEFDQYSEALSQLVKYCKIDTKKQGKNISEQRDFVRGYNKLFNNPKSRIRKMFDDKSLQNLKYGSYIDTKTSLAISLFEDILSAQLIDATPEFNRQCEFVSRYLPAEEDGDVSKDVMKKISDAILVKIRSGFFNKYAERHGIDIKGLVNGNNTIYDRLNKLKIDIATKEEYEDLRDGEGNIYNYLLNTLTNGFIHEQIETQDEKDGIVAKPQKDTYDNVKFLSTMTFMDDDSIDADEMSESWEELLEDTDHPELQQFARDLIVYAFITNGGNGGSNNIYKYIPTSWLVNPDNTGYSNSFAYHMANELDAYRSGEMIFDKKDADEVILNNWTDNQFIPTVKISDGFQVYYTGRASIDIINGVQVKPQTDVPLLMRCNINTESSSFVKIQRAHDKESQRSVAIYKKIGIVGDIATYVLVDPKGQNFGNKNKIYEYGRNDSVENEVSRQLGFNESLTMLAQQLGADITDVKDVINKLIQFVLSSNNREGSIELIKKYGVKDVLFDTVMDMVDNRSVKDQTEQTGGVSEALEELKNLNDNDRTYKVPEEIPESTPSRVISDKVQKHQGNWSRQEAQSNPNILYVFTDNTDRDSGSGVIPADSWYSKKYGAGHHFPTMTAAVVRGLDNSRPISTQRWYHQGAKGETGRWTDNDIEEFKSVIRDELQEIIKEFNTGKYDTIMFPAGDGLFNTRISAISKTRTPKLYQALGELLHEFGFDSLIPSDIIINQKDNDYIRTYKVPETEQQKKINIYAGTGENADLSNFAKRPFVITGDLANKLEKITGFPVFGYVWYPDEGEESKSKSTYNSVENAFQVAKIAFAFDGTSNSIDNVTANKLERDIKTSSPAEAKKIGITIPMSNLAISNWDKFSSQIMKELIKASFEQNPQALQRLLSTGNATLTHTQDKGKWGTEFPKLLMEVREELRGQQPVLQTNEEENRLNVKQLIDHLKASGINVLDRAAMDKFFKEHPNTLIQQALEEQWEMQDIKDKAIADGTFMKAPNGNPTNLNERQWLQVRTKNFINWFGDWENDPKNASKVVDENGEPLVVYHSNDAEKFDSSRQYSWFSSKRQTYYGNRQYPVFLNVRNLFKSDNPTMEERAMITDYGTGNEYDTLPKEYDGGMVYHKTFGYYELLTTRNSNQIKSATDNNGMFSTENDDIQMFIGNKARARFEQSLRKARPDMSDSEIKSTLDFLHSLEDNKENTAYIKTAIRWIANRSITLPQDNTKARQAFDLARKKHLDLQKYNTLGELITSPEMQPKKKEKAKFNPDEAKTFSNKRTVTTKGGRVFTVYDVENTEEGQREVCKALAAHYEMSPWCLSTFTATGEPTESAKNYWNEYDSISRKIAYENGKPVAFSSDSDQIDVGGVIGTLNGIEFVRAYRDTAYAWDKESITLEEKTRLIKDGLAYEEYNNLWLTEKGISQADFGPNDPYEKLNNPNREAWWDMEDIRPQDTLSDSIVSEPREQQQFPDIIPVEADYENTIADLFAAHDLFVAPDLYDDDVLPFFMTPEGEIYGFITPNGDIYLDETIISPEHPIHEYTHLWDRAVAQRNPKLWKRGVDLMKQTSLWNEVLNDTNYGKRWQAAEGMTSEKMEFLIASEVHSRLTGTQGEALLNRIANEKGSEGIVAKIKQWILDFWKQLKNTFSNWSDDEINNLTLDDFNKMTVRDLIDKVNLKEYLSSQHTLENYDAKGLSELQRMSQEDPELFQEYLKEKGQELINKCEQ